ncbi:MAG: hypothetical protein L3K15_02790 [Thermoplasmata archaeon]|nr:hypothetical protein [Thermoplasmata archaeon]
MRSTARAPAHRPEPTFETHHDRGEHDDDRFVGRSCYVFNPSLRSNLNDTHCSHCRHYLTARCPHIDEFLDDVEELMPD